MTTIKSTVTNPIRASFTKWDDQWAIRTDRKLTKEDYSLESRKTISGTMDLTEVCYIDVATKSGDTKTVEVLELEKSFGDSFIYSIR